MTKNLSILMVKSVQIRIDRLGKFVMEVRRQIHTPASHPVAHSAETAADCFHVFTEEGGKSSKVSDSAVARWGRGANAAPAPASTARRDTPLSKAGTSPPPSLWKMLGGLLLQRHPWFFLCPRFRAPIANLDFAYVKRYIMSATAARAPSLEALRVGP